jgi:ATP-binding cassette subfamily B protein
MINSLVTSLAMGAIIASAGSVLLLVALAFVILQTLLKLPQVKKSADLSLKLAEWSRKVAYVYRNLQMKENTAGMRTSNAGEKLLKSLNSAIKGINEANVKYMRSMLKYVIPQSAIGPLQTSIILVYIVLLVIKGDMSKIGLYASLTGATSTLAGMLSNLFGNVSSVFRSMVYGERIAKFFETVSVIEPPRKGALPAPGGVYSVELRNVSFSYKNSDFCIMNLNLSIAPGSRISIVGENGAGKSTLTKLLLRLYDPDEGKILSRRKTIATYKSRCQTAARKT